jgi:hypothetical protein
VGRDRLRRLAPHAAGAWLSGAQLRAQPVVDWNSRTGLVESLLSAYDRGH